MSSLEVSKTGPSNQGPSPDHAAGLIRLRSAAYQIGLGYLWDKFESSIPDLLVNDVNDSKIKILVTGDNQVEWKGNPEEIYKNTQNGSMMYVYRL
jgi:hypothetical protein